MQGVIRVLDRNGDTATAWDTEVEESVKQAEAIIQEARAKGKLVFGLTGPGTGDQLKRFEPRYEETMVMPCMAGG